jgi:hypothetical protein
MGYIKAADNAVAIKQTVLHANAVGYGEPSTKMSIGMLNGR